MSQNLPASRKETGPRGVVLPSRAGARTPSHGDRIAALRAVRVGGALAHVVPAPLAEQTLVCGRARSWAIHAVPTAGVCFGFGAGPGTWETGAASAGQERYSLPLIQIRRITTSDPLYAQEVALRDSVLLQPYQAGRRSSGSVPGSGEQAEHFVAVFDHPAGPT